jgi:hypothetical protein
MSLADIYMALICKFEGKRMTLSEFSALMPTGDALHLIGEVMVMGFGVFDWMKGRLRGVLAAATSLDRKCCCCPWWLAQSGSGGDQNPVSGRLLGSGLCAGPTGLGRIERNHLRHWLWIHCRRWFPAIKWDEMIALQGTIDAWTAVTDWFGDAAADIWDLMLEMPD